MLKANFINTSCHTVIYWNDRCQLLHPCLCAKSSKAGCLCRLSGQMLLVTKVTLNFKRTIEISVVKSLVFVNVFYPICPNFIFSIALRTWNKRTRNTIKCTSYIQSLMNERTSLQQCDTIFPQVCTSLLTKIKWVY